MDIRAEYLETPKTARKNMTHASANTEDAERGETIFQMIGPYNSFKEAQEYPITEQAGSLCLKEEE